VHRWSLRWRGGHRPPSPWALLDIRIIGLEVLTIVPIRRGRGLGHHGREGFDIDAWGWRDHHGWVVIELPVRPEGDPQARADEDPRPSMPMMSMPMASISMLMASIAMSMASMPVTSMPMPLVPVPATVGVPWHCTAQEQHRQDDESSHPLPPCSHGPHLSLRPHPPMCPGMIPRISPGSPVLSHRSAPHVSGGLTCVRRMRFTPPLFYQRRYLSISGGHLSRRACQKALPLFFFYYARVS
jgi:hypothetical protein